jgi:mRNA-degrading endonuclease toxin of MazEF toxin-antitoxin module
MPKYNIGEVWWTYFPFEDIDTFKHRPAIIIDEDTLAILAIKVTSKEKSNPFYIEIEDWKSAGLKVKSWAQIDRLVKLDEWRIDKKIGELSEKDLTKFLQLIMEINTKKRHEFSLLAIINPEGKYLQKYDERWKCWLFPYYRSTYSNKENIDKEASGLINQQISTSYVSEATHCKYSVSDKVYKIYEHKLYKLELSEVPAGMRTDNFDIQGQKYSWKSFAELENDPNVMEKNDDVLGFVKAKMK